MAEPIESSTEIKALIQSGWELWYIAQPKCRRLPGNWEMRHRHQIRKVSWTAIEKARRNLKWFHENTIEEQAGRNWCYLPKQKAMQLNAKENGGIHG